MFASLALNDFTIITKLCGREAAGVLHSHHSCWLHRGGEEGGRDCWFVHSGTCSNYSI